MAWTESGSRELWLAEVKRRGEQIRRRRRLAGSFVGAMALLVPVIAVASSLNAGGEDPGVRLAASGPARATAFSIPSPVVGSDGEAATTTTTVEFVPTTLPERAAASTPPQTTTTEVHRRGESVNGTVEPAPPTSVPPAGGSVVAGADPPSGTLSAASGSAAPSIMTLRPCTPADVKVSVTTDKAVYAKGEKVTGVSTLEKVAPSDCRLEGVDPERGIVYTRDSLRIDDAAGRMVRGGDEYSASTSGLVLPEPQKTYTRAFSWDQRDSGEHDCTVILCLQVPAGTYTVVVSWMGEGPYGTPPDNGRFAGRGSFQISA